MAKGFQETTCQSTCSANNCGERHFVVDSVEWVSEDVAKITFSESSSFFVRFYYCNTINSGNVMKGIELSEEETESLLTAGECFAAEQAAIRYLARCEQTERRLFAKLINKKFSAVAVKKSFQYLKEKNFLSDERFASAWLRNRLITQYEGKNRLHTELLARGIARDTAATAISDFLSEVSEEEILTKAVEKCKRLGKSGNSAVRYLLSKGFSYSQIKQKVTTV